jgi:hypothetical protein
MKTHSLPRKNMFSRYVNEIPFLYINIHLVHKQVHVRNLDFWSNHVIVGGKKTFFYIFSNFKNDFESAEQFSNGCDLSRIFTALVFFLRFDHFLDRGVGLTKGRKE